MVSERVLCAYVSPGDTVYLGVGAGLERKLGVAHTVALQPLALELGSVDERLHRTVAVDLLSTKFGGACNVQLVAGLAQNNDRRGLIETERGEHTRSFLNVPSYWLPLVNQISPLPFFLSEAHCAI
jgi:hypothetical protein